MTIANLPQPGELVVTDAGLETDMLFLRGIEMPCFSSTTLLRHDRGRRELERYFRDFLELARDKKVRCLLETPSWRASSDWAPEIGMDQAELDAANRDAVRLVRRVADDYPDVETLVSGCIGPRGDGYDPGKVMTAEEAEHYHARQSKVLADAGADLVTAITMTNIPEAIGVTRAAGSAGLPVVISFTVETDGKLPTGDTLGAAIAAVDEATGTAPAYYMINCAHPTHFEDALDPAAPWTGRIGGIRANASRMSHAELDEAEELDAGDPGELARQYRALREKLPSLRVLGGCCGTDIRHVRAIAEACA